MGLPIRSRSELPKRREGAEGRAVATSTRRAAAKQRPRFKGADRSARVDRGNRGRSGGQPPLGGSRPSRFERLPYFKPPALPEVSDSWLSPARPSVPRVDARLCSEVQLYPWAGIPSRLVRRIFSCPAAAGTDATLAKTARGNLRRAVERRGRPFLFPDGPPEFSDGMQEKAAALRKIRRRGFVFRWLVGISCGLLENAARRRSAPAMCWRILRSVEIFRWAVGKRGETFSFSGEPPEFLAARQGTRQVMGKRGGALENSARR